MSKIGVGYSYECQCFDCPMGPDFCASKCPFARKTHVDPDEITPDELIPWLRKDEKE